MQVFQICQHYFNKFRLSEERETKMPGKPPQCETMAEIETILIPFMESRGFILDVCRHNTEVPKVEAGWAATFVSADRPTCDDCGQSDLMWRDAEHGTSFVETVNAAAGRALKRERI